MKAASLALLMLALTFGGCATPDVVTLSGDGIGIAEFGDPVDQVVADLVSVLGEPTIDQTLNGPWPEPAGTLPVLEDPCTIATGYKCRDYLRRIAWEDLGFAVVFSDVRGYSMARQAQVTDPHLVVWEQWRPGSGRGLALESGIRVGSPMSEVRSRYELPSGVAQALACQVGDLFFETWFTELPDGTMVLPGDDGATTETLPGSVEVTFMWAGFHKDCRAPEPFDGPGASLIVVSGNSG